MKQDMRKNSRKQQNRVKLSCGSWWLFGTLNTAHTKWNVVYISALSSQKFSGGTFFFVCSAAATGFCLSDSVCRISRNRPIAWVSNAHRAGRSVETQRGEWTLSIENESCVVCAVLTWHVISEQQLSLVSVQIVMEITFIYLWMWREKMRREEKL